MPIPKDITKDILSLGVTERAPLASNTVIYEYSDSSNPNDVTDKDNDDIRSIIKLQRFSIPGPAITNPIGTTYLTSKTIGGANHNMVVRYEGIQLPVHANGCASSGYSNPNCGTSVNSFSPPAPSPVATAASYENNSDLKRVDFDTSTSPGGGSPYDTAIVPFPIEVFDGREGLPNDSVAYTSGTFGINKVPNAGMMSMIDIDVANLRRFLMGNFNGKFRSDTNYAISNGGVSLVSSDIPENRGWILYISDRRGDADFDGEYDMEDVFPDNVLQFNEDVNGNGTLEESSAEAPNYADWSYKSQGAATDLSLIHI